MKKNIVLTVCTVLMAVLCFCGISAAQVTETLIPVESDLFTSEDIAAGADIVLGKFSEWGISELHFLKYAGDKRSLSELDYVKANYEEPYDECMVFLSAFRTSDEESMTWAPNEDYCWSFTLVRKNGGEWVLNNWGWAEPYMNSDMYSVYDLMGGSDVILYEIAQMDGVKLLNISYTDDETGKANVEYINSLEKGKFDECAVFEVWFMSPEEAYGAWEADSLYIWTWYMGRSDKGFWETVSYGVG